MPLPWGAILRWPQRPCASSLESRSHPRRQVSPNVSRSLRFLACGFLSLLVTAAASRPAAAQNWPQLYAPIYVPTLNLTTSAADWNTVRHDLTYNMEVPANLSTPGEPAVLVAVRRKPGRALPSESDPQKVAL